LFGIGTTNVTCTAADRSGNGTTATFTVTVNPPTDQTPPTVTITNPPQSANYTIGQQVTIGFSCQDESGGSGIASCTATVDGNAVENGESLPTAAAGIHIVQVIAADNSGNAIQLDRSYTVWTSWNGPVDTPPTVNTVKAGAGIPLQFGLGGNYGLNIFAGGYPKSQSINCATLSGSPTDPIESTTSTPAGLTYNNTTSQYQYVWKTDKQWSGTCRQLIFKFAPSVPGYANVEAVFLFRFN
jgi:aminopeptidase YwaD